MPLTIMYKCTRSLIHIRHDNSIHNMDDTIGDSSVLHGDHGVGVDGDFASI